MLKKAINEGTGSSLRNKFNITIPIAGKTGTSQDFADAWFAAYTPKLVMVTRVGASLPTIKFDNGANGAGSTLALPLIAKTLKPIQNRFSANFAELPNEYVEALDCQDFTEDSGLEKFFDGIFKNDKTTLEKAQRKAERKAKRKKRQINRQKKNQKES